MKKITRRWTRENLYQAYSDINLKRQSLEQYRVMSKKQLLRHFISFIVNFDKLRHQLVEIKLENNYLNRTVELLKEQLDFYKARVEKRTFKYGIRVITKK